MAEHAFSLPKGTIRAVLVLIVTLAICYIWVVAGEAPDAFS